RSDFHAGIRLGKGIYPGLHTEKLLDEYLVAVAAPEVLAKYGSIPEAHDLSQLPLLHGDEIDWTDWCAGNIDPLRRLRGGYLDDSVALLTAVVEGLGYGIIRWSLAAWELQSGRLALASQQVLRYQNSYYFVCPEGYLTLPKVAALRNWLMQQAREFRNPPV